jgi:glycosyltransferase involved in cell wall biosynthesis
MDKKITVIITACNRLNYLKRTLESFLKHNTYPIEEFIARDDSGDKDVWIKTKALLDSFKIPFRLLDRGNLGQDRSIQRLEKAVKTEYIFHLEEDWLFEREGFTQECLEVMDESVAQVRARNRDDGSVTEVIPYNKIADKCTNHLFSFNPHLRRKGVMNFEGLNEQKLGEMVKKKNLKTLWLKKGACKHMGKIKSRGKHA